MSAATALPPATGGAKPARELAQRDLFGMPICAATMTDAISLAERAIERRETLLVGVVNAAKAVGLKIPLVCRLEGTNVEKGRELLAGSGLKITPATDLNDAAAKAVAAAKTA